MKKKFIAAFFLATVLVVSGCSGQESTQTSTDESQDVSSETSVEESQDGVFEVGTYVGTAEGKNGPVTVEVVFSADKIESVVVTENGETDGLSDPAIEDVPAQIVALQSLEVDIISGATMTSNAIRYAVAETIAQAGGEDNPLLDVDIDYNPAEMYFETAAAAIEKPVAVNGVIEVATYDELKKALGYYAYIVNSESGEGKFMYVDGSAVSGDTIKLTSDLTAEGEIDNPNNADGLDKLDVVTGATVLVTDDVTIDGNGMTVYGDGYPTFMFTGKMEDYGNGAIEATLKNITIDGATYTAKVGGSVFVAGAATLNLEDSTFTNGYAAYAGLLFNGGAAVYVNSEGMTPDVGRAILNATNCTFTDNESSDGGGGAVMVLNGDVNLYDSTFTGNKVLSEIGAGGAIALRSTSNLLIDNCVITGNEATVAGGGVYIFDGESPFKGDAVMTSEGNATVVNSVIENNTSQMAADLVFGRYYSSEFTGDQTRIGLEIGEGNTIGEYEDILFANVKRTEI